MQGIFGTGNGKNTCFEGEKIGKKTLRDFRGTWISCFHKKTSSFEISLFPHQPNSCHYIAPPQTMALVKRKILTNYHTNLSIKFDPQNESKFGSHLMTKSPNPPKNAKNAKRSTFYLQPPISTRENKTSDDLTLLRWPAIFGVSQFDDSLLVW